MINSKLKSIHEKITLMESQLLLESKLDTLSNKISNDINDIKDKESIYRKKFGDKYDEALQFGYNEASKEINKLKSGFKSLVENQTPNILEKISEYIFHTVGLVVGGIYYVLKGVKLHEETSRTFEIDTLFGSLLIANTAISMAMIGLLQRKHGRTDIMLMIAYFVAPLTEEYAKRAALNISEPSGKNYTLYFASLEGILYLVRLIPIYGAKAFLIRIPAFLMHLFTVRFQSYVESFNPQELKYISYILAVIIHSIFNRTAVFVERGFR